MSQYTLRKAVIFKKKDIYGLYVYGENMTAIVESLDAKKRSRTAVNTHLPLREVLLLIEEKYWIF